MDKFYQACYTRVGGADRNSGWQLTNTSPDIPAKLLNAFEQRQNDLGLRIAETAVILNDIRALRG